ncbi:MAG: glycosyltransferase family 9 protein [Mangrovibacterium sp.]
MTKILVYRSSAIGDVTLLLPVLKGALLANPNMEIYFMSRPFFAPLFKDIERLHFLGVDLKKEWIGVKGLYRLHRKLMSEINPDYIFDMHQVLRTHVLNGFFKSFHGKKIYKIDKGRAEKKAIVKTKRTTELPSTIDRYVRVFTQAGFEVKLPQPPLITSGDRTSLLQKINPKENLTIYKLVGIAPFSAHKQKEWGLAKFAQLITQLGLTGRVKFLLFGGGNHELEQLELLSESVEHCSVVGKKLNFSEELQLLPHLSLMISMDSANMHFASMAGIPVISIWGATHPALGFAPYMQSAQNIIQYHGSDINCRPCSVFGNKPCIYKEGVKCMSLIKVDAVQQRAVEILFG